MIVDSHSHVCAAPQLYRFKANLLEFSGRILLAQGQRVEIVQRVLGHRDIRSTLGYAELQETQVRAALERPVLC